MRRASNTRSLFRAVVPDPTHISDPDLRSHSRNSKLDSRSNLLNHLVFTLISVLTHTSQTYSRPNHTKHAAAKEQCIPSVRRWRDTSERRIRSRSTSAGSRSSTRLLTRSAGSRTSTNNGSAPRKGRPPTQHADPKRRSPRDIKISHRIREIPFLTVRPSLRGCMWHQ